MAPLFNAPAPNVPYFIPRQYPPSGTAFEDQPDNKPIPTLFQPLKIRGVEFQNRIWVSAVAGTLMGQKEPIYVPSALLTSVIDSSRPSASTPPRMA